MKTLLEKALKHCDSAEVYYREVFGTNLSILMDEMQGIESEKKTEISLRVVKNNKMGAAIATSLDDETIIERALISLEHQASDVEPFTNEAYPEVTCASERVKSLKTETMVDMAFDIVKRVKAMDETIPFGVGLTKVIKKVKLINSAGFDGIYDYTNMEIGLYTLNEQGFYNASFELASGDIPEVTDALLKQLLEQHKLESTPVSLGNEKLPVIFSGNCMGSLMLRVVGGVSGGNITKEISPLCGKMDTQVFSDKITIRDDATLTYGLNSYAFDDEGTPAQNTVIYDKGVLKRYLSTVGQSKKLGVKPTGNAIKRALFSKEIEDAPTVFESNLIVEGEKVPDVELIKGIKRGLYIDGVMGAHTGNINQGEFSMNISSGYLIEDGQLVGKVKGAMIAGNIYDLFKSIGAIGTELEPMRSIFYHMGYSPMVLFNEVNIVGK